MSYTYTALEKLKRLQWKRLACGPFCAGSGVFVAWYKRKKNIKNSLQDISILFVILYFCPVTAKIIMKYCVEEQVYWRMLWLLPIPLVLAYAGVQLIQKFSKKDGKGRSVTPSGSGADCRKQHVPWNWRTSGKGLPTSTKFRKWCALYCEVILQDQDPKVKKGGYGRKPCWICPAVYSENHSRF